MAAYDGTIRIDSSINGKGFNRGIQSMIGSVRQLGAAVGIAFGIGAVVKFGQSAVNEASNMASALIGLQSVVEGTGNSFGIAQDFIDKFTSDGLVPAQDAIKAYKNLLLRGYDTSQIETTLTALKDSAAFARASHLTLGEAIATASEGLKNENSILVDNAGVSKNVSVLWKEYADSIGTTVAALTQQQKIEAEVQGIMRETRFQTGDAAKLAGTYSGQISALGVSFLNLKIAAGNAIIPIIQKILPYIRAAVDALTVFFNRIATIVGILFGVEIGAGAAAATSALEGTAGAANDAAAAQENLGNKTEKAAKKAKGALASFDQLNVLQQQSADTAGGGAGGVADLGAGGGPVLPELDTTKFDEGLDDMRAKVLKWKDDFLTFTAPVREAFGRLIESLKPLAGTIWDGLTWVWENVLKPLGEWAITDLLPGFFDLLAGAATILNDALEGLQPFAQWLWDEFLQPIAEWTGQAIIDGLGWMSEKLQELHEWIGKNQEKWQAIVETLALVGLALLVVLNPMAAIVVAILAIIWVIAHWGEIWDWIKTKTGEVWEAIVDWFGGLGDWFKEHVTDPIRDGFNTALDWISEKFMTIFEGIKGIVKNAINGIIGFINGMLSGIADGINTVSRVAGALGVNVPAISAPQIPYLAQGAVIPPNAQFAAILGDQRSGRNIEAPESLIRQIVREEIGTVRADVNITFDGSLGELVRILKPRMDRETVRIGPNLAKGSV